MLESGTTKSKKNGLMIIEQIGNLWSAELFTFPFLSLSLSLSLSFFSACFLKQYSPSKVYVW
jgi:hypothetical protein